MEESRHVESDREAKSYRGALHTFEQQKTRLDDDASMIEGTGHEGPRVILLGRLSVVSVEVDCEDECGSSRRGRRHQGRLLWTHLVIRVVTFSKDWLPLFLVVD